MINTDKLTRRSVRLPKYDYSKNGWYYVTICTQNRKCIFGDIVDEKMKLNDIGKMVDDVWKTLPDHPRVKLDTIQIMPNHVHFVIQIISGSGVSRLSGGSRPAPTLGINSVGA